MNRYFSLFTLLGFGLLSILCFNCSGTSVAPESDGLPSVLNPTTTYEQPIQTPAPTYPPKLKNSDESTNKNPDEKNKNAVEDHTLTTKTVEPTPVEIEAYHPVNMEDSSNSKESTPKEGDDSTLPLRNNINPSPARSNDDAIPNVRLVYPEDLYEDSPEKQFRPMVEGKESIGQPQDESSIIHGTVGTRKIEQINQQNVLIIPFYPFGGVQKRDHDQSVLLILLNANQFLGDVFIPIHQVVVMSISGENEIVYTASSQDNILSYKEERITSHEFLASLTQRKGKMVTQLQ